MGKLDGLVPEGDVLQGGPSSQQLEVRVVKHYVVVVWGDVKDGEVVVGVDFIVNGEVIAVLFFFRVIWEDNSNYWFNLERDKQTKRLTEKAEWGKNDWARAKRGKGERKRKTYIYSKIELNCSCSEILRVVQRVAEQTPEGELGGGHLLLLLLRGAIVEERPSGCCGGGFGRSQTIFVLRSIRRTFLFLAEQHSWFITKQKICKQQDSVCLYGPHVQIILCLICWIRIRSEHQVLKSL